MDAVSRRAWIVFTAVLPAGCHAGLSGEPAATVAPAASGPLDRGATPETRARFLNLRRLAREHVLFGHQDDLAYGVQWSNEPGRSDVKETAGSYPAVYGWDAGGLERDGAANLDGVAFERQRAWIAEGFARGGVVTLSWHMRNPVTGGNAWDTSAVVRAILPGGPQHAGYVQWLDLFARRLRDVVELAEARGKIPALTETGVEAVPDSAWWTQTLLGGITANSVGRRIAWVLVWRNATFEREHRYHFFAPYPGQASVPDFVRFRQDSLILFEDELPDLYRVTP